MIRSNILAIILASSSIFAEEVKLKNTEEKVSYLLGRNIGDGLRQDEVKVNIESLLLGLQESYANTKSKISVFGKKWKARRCNYYRFWSSV